MMMTEAEKVGSPIHDRGPVQGISFGRWVYPLDPRPEEIFIEDIAESLCKINRFLGHFSCDSYSVAQHSCMVALIVPPEFALEGLLHDAGEAYYGDITHPMKQVFEKIAPGVLRSIEDRWEQVIARRFNLVYPMPPCIKVADNISVVTEKRDLLHPSALDWGPLPEPLPGRITPWPTAKARSIFLRFFNALCREAGNEA